MNKNGMALVTLAISVVIIMILSLAVVTNINNNNLIDTAKNVVGEYNLKNIEQAANMAYYNIYFDNLKNGERKSITVPELTARMIQDGIKEEILDNFNISISNGNITVTKKDN